MTRFIFSVALTAVLLVGQAANASNGLQPTDDKFSSAMADIYFQQVIDRGGDNRFTHLREVSGVETQNIIRENRDTLYSWGIFDVTGGLELTLPPTGGLYMSALVIDNDTFIVREEDWQQTGDIGTYLGYPDRPRTVRISHEQAVTDFIYITLRTETDATAEGDKRANALQDQVAVSQDSRGTWQSRNWDLDAVRAKQATYTPYLAQIVAQGTSKGYNERGKTEQFHHNFYSAIGWGGQLERYATYGTTPDFTEFGSDCATVTIDPPAVDYERAGFWSYQVYGLDGYIHSNNSTLNNNNTVPNADGTITLYFGTEAACGTDTNRADKNDDGFSITTRFYNKQGEITPAQLNPPLLKIGTARAGDESADFRAAAEEAYIYGLGINAMYRYYSGMAMGEGGLNAMVHSRSFLKPGEKPGSGPNVDTYYSYGWLDLGAEPYVVSLPAFGDRYYVYQLTDMYGHNFHNVGNDLYPAGPEAYAGPYTFVLASPEWQGEVPAGLPLVRATGKLVNVLYRIRVSDESAEAASVHALQDATLTLPLSAWQAGQRESIKAVPAQPLAAMQDVIYFGADATGEKQRDPRFFAQLANVLRYDPPANPNELAYAREVLGAIGFTPDFSFDETRLTPEQKAALLDGQEAGYDKVQAFIPRRGSHVGTAVFTSDRAGNYGEDWLLRSAMVVAGAMYPTVEVSRYADIFTDSEGEPLSGEHSYSMTFDADALPPVTRFWSLTMYSLGSYDIVANPIARYKIGPETPGLQRDADGNLTIVISHSEPAGEAARANWLPAPEGGFYAMVRFYAPTEPVLTLQYSLPDIVRINPAP